MKLQFKALNGLRFPACALIFTLHLPHWTVPQGEAGAQVLAGQGHAAMPYFFVLSGFVLAHAYGGSVFGADGTLNGQQIRAFLIRRAIRLYPLHWLALILILPWALLTGKMDYAALLPHLTLTQALIPDHSVHSAFNAPSWSLSAEVVFAAMFPALLLAFARVGDRARVLLLIVCVIGPAIAALALAQAGRSGLFLLYFNPFARAMEFAGGILIYQLWQRYRWQLNGFLWEGLCLLCLALSMIFTADAPYPYRLVAPFVPGALLFTMVFASGTGPLRRALSGPLALWFGRLAFAFYGFHYLVIRYVEISPLAELAPASAGRWLLIPLLFALSLLAAIVVHYGFERQIEPRLRSLFSPAPRAAS